MGNTSAKHLDKEDLRQLKEQTEFKEKDIKRIHRRYGALDTEKKGIVTINDLIKIPELANNQLRFHIGDFLTNTENGDDESISFQKFVKVMDMFKNNKLEEQYRFVFKLFDFDKDGKISSEDMLINFKLLLTDSLNEEQIKDIVDKTINEYSTDQKYISYNDFVKILNEA